MALIISALQALLSTQWQKELAWRMLLPIFDCESRMVPINVPKAFKRRTRYALPQAQRRNCL